MKRILALFQRLKPALASVEPAVERLLYSLSASAIVLVVLNEFVPRETLTIPLVGMSWRSLLAWVQTVTWSAYVLDFVLYGLASGHPIDYAFGNKEKERTGHMVELIICITWSPFTEGVLIHQLQNVLSLQTVLLVGAVAHIVRLGRGAIRQFSDHPFIVLCCATGILMTSGAAILTQVEPQTFKSFPDGLWYVYMTTFTIGTNMNPTSTLGRLVTGVVVAIGMGLGSVFIGFMAETARMILFKGGDMNAKILAALTLNNQLVQELNERLKRAVESGKDGCSLRDEMSAHRKMLEQLVKLSQVAGDGTVPVELLSPPAGLEGQPVPKEWKVFYRGVWLTIRAE
jgi:hypothetical protein